jgi:hypothetical protein
MRYRLLSNDIQSTTPRMQIRLPIAMRAIDTQELPQSQYASVASRMPRTTCGTNRSVYVRDAAVPIYQDTDDDDDGDGVV